MSSIVKCITVLFRSKRTEHRRQQERTSERPQPPPAVKEIAQNKAALVLAPGIIETLDTTTEGNSPEEPEGPPAVTQRNVEGPVAYFNQAGEVAHNFISGSIEEAEQHHITKEAVDQARQAPQTNGDLNHKLHIPTLRVCPATLQDPLVISTEFPIEGAEYQPHSYPYSPSLETPRLSRHGSDASSRRSISDSKASSTTRYWLKEQLEDARIEWPENSHTFLVPKSKQEELVTVATVTKDILARDPDIGEKAAAKYANDACRYARQLYATLAYIKKGADICPLLKEGVTDEDLPLVRKPNKICKFALCRKNGRPIKTMETWKDKNLESFDRVQWWMTAPVFVPGENHKFDKNTILPFVPFSENDETKEKKQGAYSKVYPVKIHPAHHGFPEIQSEDEQPLVAVKELFSQEKREFQKEATILKALGPRNHPHLIKLLATYERNQIYHLLFPYANANLRKYWDEHPTPDFDRETVLWTMEQMTGIASGLELIHNFEVTHPLFIPGSGETNFRNPGNVELKVEGGEQWFGRHGDIKPENILWFAYSQNYPHPKGVLQIADFGLGRFHGRDSRSGVNPDNVESSPTYEPPECKLRLPVSRAYDIWSLGCLYLEFITWLLKGFAEIEGFSDARGRAPTGGVVDDDYFYTITATPYSTKDAEVREGVRIWVAQLHAHKNCSQMIHDLLDLIMGELLVIDSKGRSKSRWLYSQLQIYQIKARKDDEYLLKPVPIPIANEEDDLVKLTELELTNGKPKRNSVTFSVPDKHPNPGNNFHTKSQPRTDRAMGKKDLLGRMKGTPDGLLSVWEHVSDPKESGSE
ncbi:hypothetical protein B0O99DRAFT_744661 [Bisporella sp. PMI_857]|nr:hypothetical protein B0O99DRAFT_744661 [Bisporella sp. PMI_857]